MLKEHTVFTMAALRILSGLLEVGAALIILRFNKIETALRVNGVLAVIGPTILLLGITLGVMGLSDRLPLGRMLMIYAGVFLIFWGTRRL
ncbi:YqhV family protein [Dethiobacter alkaliphilus]|uniref:DUF2619 domain-containing protein n=1 Tax=Dethiobacter alkaliphilus AHT 1 TaxID=555088 RepID=C0GC39_DETAL|nr:YqhV family protein [Dethiobacter alkaliphilus]EEG78774.1 conserved hypothetical protein [Dethiobacter alkaliphilus AHT 1]MCW3489400.1 YqhV family protein [Dethiobacter alkaliphilus]